MLEFIQGPAKCGKSSHLTERIKNLIENKVVEFDLKSNSGEQIILIVPEQFSYEAERSLFEEVGPSNFLNIKVTSFTRFAIEIFQQFGGLENEYADDCAKIILMNNAIKDCIKDKKLDIYKKSANYTNFAVKMVATINELKLSGIACSDFDETKLDFKGNNDYLALKSKEIASIFAQFEKQLEDSIYIDQMDDLSRALALINKPENIHYIKGKHIFIDEFKGFTKIEKEFMTLMMQHADVYLTLCLDETRPQNLLSPFASMLKVKAEILQTAQDNSISVETTNLSTKDDRNKVLKHLEQNIFEFNPTKFSSEIDYTDNIRAVICGNEYTELEYVLSTIKSLVKNNGYHYNDIAIITRDTKPYEDIYSNLFEKYEVPVFYDAVNSVVDTPIIKFVQALLNCVVNMSCENVLTMLKCQIMDMRLSKISAFENYLYVWSIKTLPKEEFKENPAGFKLGFTDAETRTLAEIESIREFCYTHISQLKTSLDNSNAYEFCSKLMETVEAMGVKKKIQGQIYYNIYTDETFAADELTASWGIFTGLLSTLGSTIGDKTVDIKNFSELFGLVAETFDMGSVPLTLDSVTFGEAERIRISNKKAVFILSVNEGVFPASPSSTSLFTPKDREALARLDLPIPKLGTEAVQEERFIAYKTLTSVGEKLFITARTCNAKGDALTPSTIFDELTLIFGEKIVEYSAELPVSYFCHTSESTIKQFVLNNDISLKEALINQTLPDNLAEVNSTLINTIDELKVFKEKEILKETAELLFGLDMLLSPTQIENYHSCPFMYFCRYGLNIKELEKAKINPSNSGSLIHQALENVIKNLDFSMKYDKAVIQKQINKEIGDYVEQNFGVADSKPERFKYFCDRMANPLQIIVKRIYDEFSLIDFKPIGYEVEIGTNDPSGYPSLEFEDNSEISVTGKIDRVDTWVDDNGKTYVRIVDYKSGVKKFNIDDVHNGLNLQMLIYMLTITSSKPDLKPAGILYMPSGEKNQVAIDKERPFCEELRDINPETILEKYLDQYQMNGLLIAENELDPVLYAMGRLTTCEESTFIPDEKSIKSKSELDAYNDIIKNQILDMVNKLNDGKVPANPIAKKDKSPTPCGYCKYSSICKFENVRQYKTETEIFSEEVERQGKAKFELLENLRAAKTEAKLKAKGLTKTDETE